MVLQFKGFVIVSGLDKKMSIFSDDLKTLKHEATFNKKVWSGAVKEDKSRFMLGVGSKLVVFDINKEGKPVTLDKVKLSNGISKLIPSFN